MEISLEAIISIIGLLLGGCGGAFFTWRYQRQKAKAEAQHAKQDVYQEIIEDLKTDREYQRQYINELQQQNDELRTDRNRMQKRLGQLADEMEDLKRTQARQGRQLEVLRPFLCATLSCPHRQSMMLQDLPTSSASTNNDQDGEGGDNNDGNATE